MGMLFMEGDLPRNTSGPPSSACKEPGKTCRPR